MRAPRKERRGTDPQSPARRTSHKTSSSDSLIILDILMLRRVECPRTTQGRGSQAPNRSLGLSGSPGKTRGGGRPTEQSNPRSDLPTRAGSATPKSREVDQIHQVVKAKSRYVTGTGRSQPPEREREARASKSGPLTSMSSPDALVALFSRTPSPHSGFLERLCGADHVVVLQQREQGRHPLVREGRIKSGWG